MEVSADDLELRDGYVVVKGAPDRRISLAEVAQKSLTTVGGLHSQGLSYPEPAAHDPSRLISCFYPAFHYPSFFCHAVEVELDPGTGQVEVLRYVGAHDVGFAINPDLAAGQIQGGAVQGIGMALMEEIIYQDGEVQNKNWTDYKLPTIMDMPHLDTTIVESYDPDSSFGNKEVGEGPCTAVVPASRFWATCGKWTWIPGSGSRCTR